MYATFNRNIEGEKLRMGETQKMRKAGWDNRELNEIFAVIQ